MATRQTQVKGQTARREQQLLTKGCTARRVALLLLYIVLSRDFPPAETGAVPSPGTSRNLNWLPVVGCRPCQL